LDTATLGPIFPRYMLGPANATRALIRSAFGHTVEWRFVGTEAITIGGR